MLTRTFSSLKHRNYRLFFFGQLFSLVGTWMHWVAQQWLVYDLTDSKALLGIISACQTIPMLVFAIPGGLAADRFSKKNILLGVQFGMMISALAMGFLVLLNLIEVWHIVILAIFSGICGAFAMPARQSFVIELVGKDDLMNAIGLNSSIFNTARMLGPAIAAIVMSEFSIGYCFLINGVSYIAVIISLFMMNVDPAGLPVSTKTVTERVKEGFSYVFSNNQLLWLFSIVTIVAIFGVSHVVLIPAFAKDILLVDEKGYGFLMTATGAGALLAALTVATLGEKAKRRKVIVLGVLIFCTAAAVFAVSRNYYFSVTMLVFSAFGITSFIATSNTFIQLSVPDGIRGRVMGIWTLMFGGAMPLGSLQAGFVAEKFGSPVAVLVGVIICFVGVSALALLVFFKQKR